MSTDYRVPPMSRSRIRGIVSNLKELTGVDGPSVDIVRFLEEGFVEFTGPSKTIFKVLEREELGEIHAHFRPDTKLIEVREDVYDGAVDGNGRDIMTLAHELGHFMLHSAVPLQRSFRRGRLRNFESAEWQASCFGGEFLMDARYAHRVSDPADMRSLFGVSPTAANYQYRVWMREGLFSHQTAKRELPVDSPRP